MRIMGTERHTFEAGSAGRPGAGKCQLAGRLGSFPRCPRCGARSGFGSREARYLFSAILAGTVALAAGAAGAAQLTLDWADNSGGTAGFLIERKTGTTGAFAQIATTGAGVTTYADTTVPAATTFCYRVRATNSGGTSGYSNEACGAAAATGPALTIGKSGTGSGTVTSSPSGINCGS